VIHHLEKLGETFLWTANNDVSDFGHLQRHSSGEAGIIKIRMEMRHT